MPKGKPGSTRIAQLIEEAKQRHLLKNQRKAEAAEKEVPENPTAQSLLIIPDWVRSMGVDDPKASFEIYGPDGKPVFKANPGPQTWSMFCPYDEIVIGGRRGGGKSVALKAWMASGDLSLPYDDPARATYLNDPSFKGLFLREEYQSMLEFIDEAVEFFRVFGGTPTGGNSKPVIITFGSGARIYFNHLGDESAFEKYRGWSLTRIGIEELTQIPTLKRYVRLLGSVRAADRIRNGKRLPALRTQLMSTTNPDGPGHPWVMDRFIDVYGGDGKLIPWNTPMKDPNTGLVRIFIPFPMESNPYYGSDTAAGKKYLAMLLSQDEVTRRQWIEGDWHAGSSKFFMDYRPNGPVTDDEKVRYPWAFHIIKPVRLQPWWYRWGSGDWGYDHPSANHKYVRNEDDKRVHVYDELQVRRVGSFELGALLAKWWYPELIELQRCGIDPNITLHFGADIFKMSDETRTQAQLMASGIQEVLGPYGAILLKFNEDEQEVMIRDPKRAQMMYERRRAEIAGHMCIALKPVYVDRVKAWGYCREWLRFRPAVMTLQTEEQRQEYLQQVYKEQGMVAYELQAAELRTIKPEILPKIQIWEHCRELDRCLRTAERDMSAEGDPSRASKREDVRKFNADDEGKNGDDALESWRNSAIAFQEIRNTIPRSYFVNERIADAQKAHVEAFGEEITDVTRLAMISARQNHLYGKEHAPMNKAFTPQRAGATSRRFN